MNKKALAGFLARFQDILDALDGFEMTDALEELNAEFEDALFMIESIDPEEEDAQEELEESFEELHSLLEDYRELAKEVPELLQKTVEMEMCLKMAESNLA